jgi:hypothetical protein
VLLWLAACAADCGELPATCTPQYTPTFDAVYANTLAPSCALAGCHGTPGATPLDLGDDPDAAWDALQPEVTPGEPGCGELVRRLEDPGPDGMPPGAPLSVEERCAVRTWIADGAAR